ncbi:ABC transporter ATP-binding protein [Serratia fonticola]|uniref:ABC transporter ATP-binding protein n=1 Tax=Serratia fonticola TaxID=47917 RepID=UPI000E0FD0A7|nr:ABC transporter ATP-binding protein [Serratia fonticola]RDL22051.1 peptide/nickel transport system ATP-binding protein [Serratia fonticola]
MTEPLLTAQNLSIEFNGHKVVDNLSFSIGREKVALVGESGSGKSMTARALMGLVRKPGIVTADKLHYRETDLLKLQPRQWNEVRGAKIAMVLQDPRYALNPARSIGKQIEESLVLHNALTRADRHERVLNSLAAVGLPESLYHSYPGQLSGGMGQRAMLAIALVNDPQLLIADEPTSALDARLRNQILDLIVEQTTRRNMGLLLISHDLPLVAERCDRVLVMYQGKLVDQGIAANLPLATHPYTRTLWACRPNASTYGQDLPVLDRSIDFTRSEHGAD